MFDFKEKTVLVTGASRGLGRAIALSFAEAGAHVGVGFGFREKDATQTLADVREGGGSGELCQFDVRDRAATDQAVRTFAASHSRLDVMINNAGVVSDAFAVTMTEPEWDQVLDVNLKGTFNGCRSAASLMMAQKSGVIVNISSVAGSRASPGQANYAASKGGVLALTKTLASELAPKGVRVNA